MGVCRRSDSRGYTLYYKIPFSDFGLEQVPAELKMNIGRTVNGNANEQSVLLHQNNYCFFADMQKAYPCALPLSSPVWQLTPSGFEKGNEFQCPNSGHPGKWFC